MKAADVLLKNELNCECLFSSPLKAFKFVPLGRGADCGHSLMVFGLQQEYG